MHRASKPFLKTKWILWFYINFIALLIMHLFICVHKIICVWDLAVIVMVVLGVAAEDHNERTNMTGILFHYYSLCMASHVWVGGSRNGCGWSWYYTAWLGIHGQAVVVAVMVVVVVLYYWCWHTQAGSYSSLW